MGAGQIGGIATLLDIDFQNPAEFIGTKAIDSDAQFVVHYLSHAMLFCVGALIETHVVVTPASCVLGERYKFNIIAGTHKFMVKTGIFRQVNHLCIHRGYNHTLRWMDCSHDNIALLVLDKQFSFNKPELGADFVVNRVRYGIRATHTNGLFQDRSCKYYGWGSRRNGYLIPLLIHMLRVDVTILPEAECLPMFNYGKAYLCVQEQQCKSEKYGQLCPDDVGSVLVCSGFAQGIMTSRLVDRPCGVGFLDLNNYSKFLMCGVDDSRDVVDHDNYMYQDLTTPTTSLPTMLTISLSNKTTEVPTMTPPSPPLAP